LLSLAAAWLAALALALPADGALEGLGPAASSDPVLVGAGGIAGCASSGDEATAALLDGIAGTVFTAGDSAYEDGKASEWANCYDPSWGRHKGRTRPVPGNHDWATDRGNPYFDYWGKAAGTRGQGWYSYDLGAWHVVVLNSNCPGGGTCEAGSSQERWLRADLATKGAYCTAAFIHHPRFSSDSIDGSQPQVGDLWDALYDAGADLVVSGHSRVYERMAPQDPKGKPDPNHGLLQINVGSGGRGHGNFDTPLANSVVRDRKSWGVLKLTLHPGSFDWDFVPVPGAPLADAGSARCHGKPSDDEPPPSAGNLLTFSARADATVSRLKPTTNYGGRTILRADTDPGNEAYVRFAVTGVSGRVRSVRLRLWVTSGSDNGPAVYATALGTPGGPTPWAETAVTWNKRPSRTTGILDDKGVLASGSFVDYDVTDAFHGNGLYSFDLAGTVDDGTEFAAREDKARRPRLVVELTP
jgi:calcineurin-like phosphoesterase family protein